MVVFYCFLNLGVVSAVFAAWVILDGLGRPGLRAGATWLLWGIGTLILAPLILPVYIAKRPLKGKEVRRGGPDWIVARRFVGMWTLYLGIIMAWTLYLTLTGDTTIERGSGVSQADFDRAQAVSRGVAVFFLFLCWLIPALAAWVIGPQLYDPDAPTEYGPEAIRGSVQVD